MARGQAVWDAAMAAALRAGAAQQGSLGDDILSGLYDGAKGFEYLGQWGANMFHDVAMGNWGDFLEDLGQRDSRAPPTSA